MHGGPHTIYGVSIKNGSRISIKLSDILFGDVWVCGGQSNMGLTVSMVSAFVIKWPWFHYQHSA